MSKLALALIILTLAATSAAQDAEVSAEALDQEIETLRVQARYAEAAELARQLLELRRSDPKAMPFEIADAEGLVETLEHIAGLPEAVRRELALADSLTWVDRACWADGRYREGAAAMERQLEIRRRLLGEEHFGAEPLYREALAMFRRLLSDDHPAVAGTLHNLAVLLQGKGDYASAEPLYREALTRNRDLLGDHPYVAMTIDNLAGLLQAEGDYAGAEPLYREALEMRRAFFGDEHTAVASSLRSLAGAFYARGDYAAAEPLYREALAMRRRLLGDEHPRVASSLSDLAGLLYAQGDYLGAEPFFREALAMDRRLLGDEHSGVATDLNNLALLLRARGEYATAELLYREALAMYRKLLGDDHENVATTLNNLAYVLKDREDYEGAERLFREALAVWRRVYGEEHPDVATCLANLAILLEEQDDYEGAERLYREAIAMSRRLLIDEQPEFSATLANLALLLSAQGDHKAAEPLLAEAARVHDAARLRVGAGLARAAFRRSPYPSLAAVRLALGRTDEAWPAAEKAHARSLADLLMATDERDLTAAESAREDSLAGLLSTLERNLAAYREAASGDTTGEASGLVETIRSALLATEAEWSVFQREIALEHPVTEGETFALERVQSGLPEKTAIVGWLDAGIGRQNDDDGGDESWCYAIRRSGAVHWARAGLSSGKPTSGSSSARARSLRYGLARPESPGAVVAGESRDLWAERIEPLTPALRDVERLIVVPSGAMLGVPAEALESDKGVLVGETYAVSYAPSATVHTWLAERVDREVGTGALLVGDPPYNPVHLAAMRSEEDVLLASADVPPEPQTLRSALAGDKDALAALPRLYGTRDEVAAIADLPQRSSLLVGPDATEQELVRLAESGEIGEFGTIHIATHALVDDERPARSALVLSQVELPNPLESARAGARIYDGVVTAKEILREWELNADLVTLSACETGLGKQVGGEGYVGFAHAFLQAGARCLLVSLWKVEDRATSLLMSRFYENLFGKYDDVRHGHLGQRMTKAEALQEAKQWLRSYTDEHGDRPYQHPYFWSAFILIGDAT
jgi:CHAT domain-containing protein/tetratricopeptide (TPR) repeat protein